MATLQDMLASVVGHGQVTAEPDRVSAYFEQPPKQGARIFAVFPKSVEQVQGVVRVAGEFGVSVFTTSDTLFSPEAARADTAVLLDFSRMNAIERLDGKNLMAHVQRGVTFEQLKEALAPLGMKISMPAAATSTSVAEQYVARGVTLRAARYHEVAASNMQVVLADGRVHLTGSHALSEETADHKGDGAANLSQWYLGADDALGIVTRASVWCFPVWEKSVNLAYGFKTQPAAADFVKECCRRELCTMGLVMNAPAFAEKVGAEGKLPEYVAILGVEGVAKLVDHRVSVAGQVARAHKAGDVSSLLDGRQDVFESPWYAMGRPRLGFYSLFPRVAEFDAVLSRQGFDENKVSRFLVSVALGSCVWVEYGFPDGDGMAKKVEKLSLALAKKGAFFDRPAGKLARQVYGSMDPGYMRHLSRVKNMLDPARTLNPGHPIAL
ncbi:MAG: FAD-binding oxidoreductase [Deltaproteobacteria bacterium]|nr:FAD-binding oxidoreductase [Deltaproteobacteria bacterium]